MTEKDIEELLLNSTGEEAERILEQDLQQIHEELLCRYWEKMEPYINLEMTKLMYDKIFSKNFPKTLAM